MRPRSGSGLPFSHPRNEYETVLSAFPFLHTVPELYVIRITRSRDAHLGSVEKAQREHLVLLFVITVTYFQAYHAAR